MSLAGATQDEVRRHNLAALARFLHDHGSTSRSELVSHTGLNRSTITALYRETATRIELPAVEQLCALFRCSVGDLLEVVPDNDKGTP